MNNIKDMDIPDRAMVVSFDVKNLFFSVPVKEFVEITTSKRCLKPIVYLFNAKLF